MLTGFPLDCFCDVVIKNVLPCTFLIGEFGKAETSLLHRTTAIRGGSDSHKNVKTYQKNSLSALLMRHLLKI